MTIIEAIELLRVLQQKYGNVDVFFDCPFCKLSFSPEKVEAIAIHISGKK